MTVLEEQWIWSVEGLATEVFQMFKLKRMTWVDTGQADSSTLRILLRVASTSPPTQSEPISNISIRTLEPSFFHWFLFPTTIWVQFLVIIDFYV